MPAVSIDGTGGTIVSENYSRLGIIISNSHATSNLHLTFDGTTATTNEAYIPPGGSLSVSDYRMKHKINGISSSGTITVKYSEIKN